MFINLRAAYKRIQTDGCSSRALSSRTAVASNRLEEAEDRADRRAMAAWRRRVVIMIPSNMIDVLARVLVLAGITLVHRSARGKITLESASCTDLESWIGIEVRLAVVTSAVTDVARELTFLFSSHARARALSTGQPDARRLAATHEDAELPDEPHGRARASPREGA